MEHTISDTLSGIRNKSIEFPGERTRDRDLNATGMAESANRYLLCDIKFKSLESE